MSDNNNGLEFIKEQLNAILESSYDGIYITDGEGRFLNINNRLLRITGYKKEELIGTYAQDLVKTGKINKSVIEMVIERKERVTINQSLKGKTIKEIMVTATPILDENGKIKYIVANVRDMTDLIYLKNECNKAQSLSKQYYSELIKERGYPGKIVAESEEMKKIMQLAYRVAQVNSNILLEGESGTGKEVIARFIHEVGPRNRAPFISINCAGIHETLLEAELFGYEEGAFTGAKKGGKVGLIELADGGTLFLDELNSLPVGLQGKLLRVIETYEITRLGRDKSKKINFRLIAAANKDLKELVGKGLFREDLYFRVNTVPIILPPLRQRKKDIIPLAIHYLQYFNKKYNFRKDLSTNTFKYLEAYNWPGNVRELKNTIERLVVMTENDLITEKDLPNELINSLNNDKFQIIIRDLIPLKELTDEAETKLIKFAMEHCHSTREAAKALKISQTSVVRKYKRIREKSMT
ncbi:sigma-54 interaction domain-containing protein [Thermoanaerobacterium thermosaccharolyticum]|uniref:sigma-54 interaction domain-containing protein n=1 Tax=Thermoanaerobacterium thermosaccharolyticum TaxID=1517 RepID=UPI00177B224A|nr:sigma 54-interacting transcriptional regulator [Thermoanaerobacterium thermosaccharolyticum]MBE0068501.1 PAS domain S-box protein [Thermoanaerobacterium thermosaccharolyticum]